MYKKRDQRRKRIPSPAPKRFHLDRRADAIADKGAGADDDLLSTNDLAEWFNLSHQWFEIGRHKGYGPKFVKLGPKRVRYRRADVLEWLRARTHQSTSEYGR